MATAKRRRVYVKVREKFDLVSEIENLCPCGSNRPFDRCCGSDIPMY